MIFDRFLEKHILRGGEIMKAIVNQETCTGCALCTQTCPDIFEMDGDKAKVLVGVVPKDKEECSKKAADECPVTAISIEE